MSDLTKFDRPVNIGNPQMGWASDVAAEMLRRMGIKYLSMNPGASYRGFHDSIVNYLGNKDPQMILCLHEDHAVHIAQGYAKATNEPMGCILHSNVGLMHGMMAIFNSWCNRVPMIIMGATGPVDAPKRVRGSTGSTPRRTRARWSATSPSGTTSRAPPRRWPTA